MTLRSKTPRPSSRRRRPLKALLASAACLALVLAASPASRADTTPNAPAAPGWALTRISPNGPTHSHGAGVNAFVIDAGFDYDNPDLGGRGGLAYDADAGGDGQTCPATSVIGSDSNDKYEYKHGNELADILGGTQYGVANQVKLWSVKAFHCDASNWLGSLNDAINWLAATVKADPGKYPDPVAVLARNDMGSGWYGTLNDGDLHNELTAAVNNLAAAGVFVAVSAGDDTFGPQHFIPYVPFVGWVDTWSYTVDNPPANAAQALVVMASDSCDHAVLNGNAAPCAESWSTPLGGDIYAPGEGVPAQVGSGQYAYENGTSDAAPLVAGVAALYKATYGDAPSATVKAWIIAHATQGAITNNPPEVNGDARSYTPNLLLNTGGL